MSVIVFASPAAPTGVAPGLWMAGRQEWTGADGVTWDISHDTMGVKLMPGVRGMDMPDDIQIYTSDSAAVDGNLVQGDPRVGPREVFWPIRLRGGSSADFKSLKARFWRGLTPFADGVWRVYQFDGEIRELSCRFVADSTARQRVPEAVGRIAYGITLKAFDPFWRGPAVTTSFGVPPEQRYFFGGQVAGVGVEAAAPPFGISAAFSGQQIVNDGDVPVWPVWRLWGPLTAVTVGVGDRLTSFAGSIGAGEWVDIDFDPRAQMAVDHAGVDRTTALTAADFATIPVGISTVVVSLTGAGSADCTFRPAFMQAD